TDEKLPAVTDYRVHARNAAAMWEALSKGYGALLVDSAEVRIVAPSPYHALRAIVLDPRMNRDATVTAIRDTVLVESGLARHGVARTVMIAILRAYPDDVVTLTATDQGRPLYDSLGFDAVSKAVWWRPHERAGERANHKEDDRGEGLR